MGTKVEAPQPSAEETQLQQMQLQLAQRQATQQQALEPFQLQAAGLVKEPDGTLRRQTEEERVAGQTELQRQQEGVQRSLLERQQMALAGELPVSPALEAQLGREGGLLEEQISRSGRRGGTLGTRQRSLFKTRADLVREEARRGQITGLTGSSLGFAGLSGQQQAQQFGGLQGLGQGAQGTLGLLQGAAQPFQQQRMLEFQASQQTAANRAGLIGAGLGAVGTVAGAGLVPGGFLRK
ncbi:MAG: hypothetical protein V3R78_10200 [Thermodesulfobacteriota bacterium]